MEESTSIVSQLPMRTQRITKFKVDTKSTNSKKTKSDIIKRSCDNCRKRKVRCDSIYNNKCSQCRKTGIECQFLAKPKKTGPPTKQYTESLERQVKLLQQLLQEERTKNTRPSTTATTISTQTVGTTTVDSDPTTAVDIIELRPASVLQQYNNTSLIPLRRSCNELIKEIPNLTPELAERMIIGYFDMLHPNCAIVDKRSFLIQYYYEYPHPVDENLFYAVCAVGSQFLPRHEFSVTRTAGRNLREKAMQVMNKAYKRSSLTTVQVLILMSLLAPNSDNNEGSSTNWLLLGAAIRMGQDLELHCDSHQNLPNSEIQVRRRTAYILYALDKISAASSGRPYAVKDEDFDVSIPSEYEAEPEVDPVTDMYLSGQMPRLLQDTERDIREKHPIYSGFLEIIPLARMIGYVLASFYTCKAVSRVDVTDLDTRLMTWQANPDPNFTGKHGQRFIRTLYDGLLLLRYRPLVLFSQKTSEIDFGRLQMLNVCNTIATNMIEFLEASPVWGVPCLKDYMIAQAATIFLQNCNNEDDAVRLRARQNLARCAALYQRDDIVNQTKNAIVLNELANQLSEEETARRGMQRTVESTFYNSMNQEVALTFRQRQSFDSYDGAMTNRQQQSSSQSSVPDTNLNQVLLESLLRQQAHDVL
ncbi:fungal-specific transcription factor domain-containing protein [Phascolomyces articulosus]|uniref:Fungal-specific transcription factor domain-containing protein n=1 Tax=Phascolomyces articulosus TaxID=60185 RepID=A0AAD5P9N9_9FUNG|nr:fungal-specific transcription factor domain-containing protein [Phascolomyces articulosus]